MSDQTRPGAFEALFDRMYPSAVRLATRMVGPSHGEDVAVDAFARTLVRWTKVRELPHLDAWLMRVTANIALDQLRRQHQGGAMAEVAPDTSESVALRVTLGDALRRLPKRQSEVLALRYLAGLNETEVSGALGISLGSVKTHARRGLRSLRATLGSTREELFDVG